MHFFYLDETGCAGHDLNSTQEPIFLLGGVSVRDKGWTKTTEGITNQIEKYFKPEPVPSDFELHAHELLSPKGDGPFAGHDRGRRNQLAFDLLDFVGSSQHHIHFIALDKNKLAENANGNEHDKFDARIPYLLGFDYMITSINERVRTRLGRSARGITIIDEKPIFEDQIAALTRFRRLEVPNTHRIKWLVEFSYSIDSKKHPMIQLSDLVIYCAKKFLELDGGYRNGWTDEAKEFYARCFDKVWKRVRQKTILEQDGRHAKGVRELLPSVVALPRHSWKKHYGV